MFQNKVVVITGGANGIGKCIAEEFQKNGAHVCVIDRAEGDHYVGDLADKATLEDFARTVTEKYGRVDVLVNNAPPLFLGLNECTYEQLQQPMAIGVTAPFYLSKASFSMSAEIAAVASSGFSHSGGRRLGSKGMSAPPGLTGLCAAGRGRNPGGGTSGTGAPAYPAGWPCLRTASIGSC